MTPSPKTILLFPEKEVPLMTMEKQEKQKHHLDIVGWESCGSAFRKKGVTMKVG